MLDFDSNIHLNQISRAILTPFGVGRRNAKTRESEGSKDPTSHLPHISYHLCQHVAFVDRRRHFRSDAGSVLPFLSSCWELSTAATGG